MPFLKLLFEESLEITYKNEFQKGCVQLISMDEAQWKPWAFTDWHAHLHRHIT